MPSRFDELVELRQEKRNLEYKRSEPWDTLRLKITKCALGMANTSDGGVILVGIQRQADDSYIPTGVPEDVAATYNDDHVSAFVNTFADPHIDLRVQTFTYNEMRFVAITVSEFAREPIIARQDADGIRAGAIYVRPLRMRETAEVRSSSEMREILDRATEKALGRLLGTLERAGIPIERLVDLRDESLYSHERKGL